MTNELLSSLAPIHPAARRRGQFGPAIAWGLRHRGIVAWCERARRVSAARLRPRRRELIQIGVPGPVTPTAIGERIRILALTQGLLVVLLLLINLCTADEPTFLLTLQLGGPVLLASGALYALRHTRLAAAAVYWDLTLVALLLAIADPLSGTLTGNTWVLFQILPPLAALTLRRPRAAVFSVVMPLLLLILAALLQITGVVPVQLLAPPATLLRHLNYQAMTLIILGVALHWLSTGEQRAWRAAIQAQAQLQHELAQVQALAAEKAAWTATLEQQVAERSALAEQRAAALAASDERYALALRATNDGLWDWNFVTQEVFFSPRWQVMLGYGADQVGATPAAWYALLHPQDRARVLARLVAQFRSPADHFALEYRIAHHDGSYRWMLCRGVIVRDAAARIIRLVGAQTDITDRKRAEARLRYATLHDSLTGLPNRTLFADRLAQAIRRGRSDEAPTFAVLVLNLDRFQTVNDSLGPQAGDALLIAVARRLEGCLRPGDTVARLGGDEFAILIEPLTQAAATALATQFQRALAVPFPLQGQDIYLSASVGIVVETGGYERPADLLRDADAARHQARLQGNGGQAVFDPPMYCQAVARLQLESDLHRAVARNEFRLHYQPVVMLSNAVIVGFEALVRWQHPGRGLVAPGDFLPLAEDTGLITPLSDWVLREACRQLAAWQTALAPLPPLTISVNLPAWQLTQPGLVARIAQILRQTGLAAHQLKIEIVENTLVAQGDAAATALSRLKALGVQLSIDDFGTGYSSLSYLHRFPVDTIKIDRSFISRLATDHQHAEIIAAIVTLARSLGMSTVAEGVETADQQRRLQALGCDYGQGWLFAPALDAEQATTLVATLRRVRPRPRAV